MAVAVPVARARETLQEVHQRLLERSADFATINYVYVLDADGKLHGVLSVKELFSKPLTRTVGEVCKKTFIASIHPESHQKDAAYLALKHGIKAIPVVDKNHVFLGEIANDAILSILHKEMHGDTLKRAGIRHPGAVHSNVLELSLWTSLRHRIPWLLIGLFGGLLAARIIGVFEETLAKNLVLAAFIPLIVYMSDAVGTQMEAYIIRDLAIEKKLPFLRYLVRHFIVVSAIALVLAVLLIGSYGTFYHDWHMAGVLGLALFFAVLSSVVTGLVVPYLFSRFTLDPADASGPVATVLQDILSIVIYFGIATLLL